MKNTTPLPYYIVAEINNVLTATLQKRVSVNEYREMLKDLKKIALGKKLNKVLINGIAINFEDLSMLERHDIGVITAEVLGGEISQSCVVLKEYINKHGENVARNRGANVMVTHDLIEAHNWLSDQG